MLPRAESRCEPIGVSNVSAFSVWAYRFSSCDLKAIARVEQRRRERSRTISADPDKRNRQALGGPWHAREESVHHEDLVASQVDSRSMQETRLAADPDFHRVFEHTVIRAFRSRSRHVSKESLLQGEMHCIRGDVADDRVRQAPAPEYPAQRKARQGVFHQERGTIVVRQRRIRRERAVKV